jgi:sugar/nucleoside kinase (ribokinase family)
VKKVFTCGGASWNAVITLDAFPGAIPQTIHECDFDETLGNTGAGKALNLARLGFETTLHALLGNDHYGDLVRKELDQPNLHFITDNDPQGTERHLNILNANGERISIFINPSFDEPNLDHFKMESLIEASDYAVINISNYCRHLLPICQKLGKEIWTDLHDYDGKNEYHQDFIEAADYIFLSSDNLPNYKEFMESMIVKGKQLVVCTHAKNGASALTVTGKWFDVPIVNAYQLVNANGAGDSFFSGFLYAFDQGYDTLKCLQYASIVAGLCIESKELYNETLSVELLQNHYDQFYNNVRL